MVNEISWFGDGLEREVVEYSDGTLVDVIREESKNVVSFSRISMWYMQDDEIHGCIAVDLHAEDRRLGGNKMLRVYDFNLLEEDFADYTKEAQRIKRVLQKAFPGIRVSSNFR